MRILFAGTPSLAVPCLRRIAPVFEIVGVLTSHDQPAGRGRGTVPSPVKEAAVSLGLRVFQPERLDEPFIRAVQEIQPQMLVVAAYGKIFRPSFLAVFPLGGINVHPSLLPRHRGPSPISAAILAGDQATGVTIQRIAQKFDTGDILKQGRHPLDGTETTASLTDSLATEGADLLLSVLNDIAAGCPPAPVVQDEAEASYCHPVRKEDGQVSWAEPAEEIERKVRAFDPWPRAFTTWRAETLLLLKSHVYPDTLPEESGDTVAGLVAAADRRHGLLVRTGRGVLAVERLQLQFKKPLDWRAFLNGHPDIVGTRLGHE
jgi:methionyl-tRNA formyltransferase